MFCSQSSIDKKKIKHPFASISTKYHDFCQNRFQFKTKTLSLEPIKTCYRCMKTLDYLLIMIYELAETKIKSK